MSYTLAPPEPPNEPTQTAPGSPTVGARTLANQRLLSLDVYRGMVMITLAFSGFGLAKTAQMHLAVEGKEDSWLWNTIRGHFTHVEWVGCGLWDLIQPAFMFIVGVSLAYSMTKRVQNGQGIIRLTGHTLWRSIVLIVFGIFLTSNGQESTRWLLTNVLTQIGLGYTFLFLLWGLYTICGERWWILAVAALAILIATAVLYTQYPSKSIDLETGAASVHVESEWAKKHLDGVGSSWHKNANVGHEFDLWLLNKLPQVEPFEYNKGGYQTLNFLPSLATMLIGLLCGELLRSGLQAHHKLLILLSVGLSGLVVGHYLDLGGVCPLVKRIWTPTWCIYSTGWCCLMLVALYSVIDVLKIRFWTFPFVVVGMNSIAMYCMGQLLKPWVAETLKTHLGPDIFTFQLRWGDQTYVVANEAIKEALPLYAPTIQAFMVGMIFWLVCWWLYRRKIFLRI